MNSEISIQAARITCLSSPSAPSPSVEQCRQVPMSSIGSADLELDVIFEKKKK
jgi:hypothetical protein